MEEREDNEFIMYAVVYPIVIAAILLCAAFIDSL